MATSNSTLFAQMRLYYFEEDRTRMSRLLMVGALLPLVLAIESLITAFDPKYVVNYNFMLTILIAGAGYAARRIRDYQALDRFSWMAAIILLPAFLYLRYTGLTDVARYDTISVDFLLDMVIVFVMYTALPLGPKQKLGISSIFISGVLLLYGTHLGTIAGGLEAFTTITIAYLIGSLLGYGNAALIENTRLAAFNSLNQEKKLNADLSIKNDELSNALSKVNALSGLLPICANCKKIRDDQGYYQQIEHYITEHSEAEFTHGICPDCAQLLYPEIEPSS